MVVYPKFPLNFEWTAVLLKERRVALIQPWFQHLRGSHSLISNSVCENVRKILGWGAEGLGGLEEPRAKLK